MLTAEQARQATAEARHRLLVAAEEEKARRQRERAAHRERLLPTAREFFAHYVQPEVEHAIARGETFATGFLYEEQLLKASVDQGRNANYGIQHVIQELLLEAGYACNMTRDVFTMGGGPRYRYEINWAITAPDDVAQQNEGEQLREDRLLVRQITDDLTDGQLEHLLVLVDEGHDRLYDAVSAVAQQRLPHLFIGKTEVR